MENRADPHKRILILRDQLNAINLTSQDKKKPVRILITGACGNIGYSLIFMISQGRMFGPDQPVILHLFDLPHMEEALKGVRMEVFDGAYSLVKGIVATTKPEVAFADVDYAVMCGSRPRTKGMERSDLLSINGKIFEEQGKYFDKYASRNVKVLVVGNPANTNCLSLIKNAPSIDPKNFTALTRLDHNRMIAQIGEKLNLTDLNKIKNCTIWGNHSLTQFPHIDYGVLKEGENSLPLNTLINDKEWVDDIFIKNVSQRGAQIIAARKLSSAASAASSACDHMRDWILGTENDNWVSMGVISHGEYNAEKDVVFSFPVHCKDGEWTIVKGLQLNSFAEKKIKETGEELRQEKEMAFKK